MQSQISSLALHGALDPAWLDGWIAERGPWAYHVTSAEAIPEIERHGLVPSSDRRSARTVFSVAATPRPGYVYFVSEPEHCDHQWELSGVDPVRGAVVCLDLRQIEPERVVPDEDPWTLGVADWSERRWGLDPQVSREIGPGREWETGGAWAEAVQLGAQPGIVEWAMSEWGRFAVSGPVGPARLRIVMCGRDGDWSPPSD